MIPERLLDKTLHTRNPNKLYPLCILIRILIGLAIYFNCIDDIIIYLICIFVVFAFTFKYLKLDNTWKVYLRTIITYTLSSILVQNGEYNSAGLLIILDSLGGLQSKHIQGNFIS